MDVPPLDGSMVYVLLLPVVRPLRSCFLPPRRLLLKPPANTPLDFARGAGRHVGSMAIRERAEGHSGVLVCGHIHESFGVAQLGDCLMLNAGGLGRPYGRSQIGFVLGLDEVRHEDLETGRFTSLNRRGVRHNGRITT